MPPVQAGIKTPGVYTDVNINTQRAGLPSNEHKVLFVTDDAKVMAQPVAIYDEADAADKIVANSKVGKMIKAAVKTNRLVDAYAITLAVDTTDPQDPFIDVDETLDIISPLGHTIIALNSAPTVGDQTMAWTDHLNFVSDAIEQRPAILVIPFSGTDLCPLLINFSCRLNLLIGNFFHFLTGIAFNLQRQRDRSIFSAHSLCLWF